MRDQLNKPFIVSDTRGFSLIELLVVIAIIGIVVSFSIPNFKVWLSHSQVNSDARRMLAAFQQARMEAVKRSEYCAVAFAQDVSGVTYDYVVFFDADVDRVYDAGETVFLKADFDQATTVTHNFANVAIFNSRGLPSDSPTSVSPVIGSVELSNDGYSRTVAVSRFGRIRIL